MPIIERRRSTSFVPLFVLRHVELNELRLWLFKYVKLYCSRISLNQRLVRIIGSRFKITFLNVLSQVESVVLCRLRYIVDIRIIKLCLRRIYVL